MESVILGYRKNLQRKSAGMPLAKNPQTPPNLFNFWSTFLNAGSESEI